MAYSQPKYGAFKPSQICPSSWVSWGCYGFGLMLALTPESVAEIFTGGVGSAFMATAILLFFVSASMVQRFMRLSLLSSSYGEPQTLTTGGVFGVTRNPIYVAFLLPLISICYYSVPAAMTACALYIGAMTFFVIQNEEIILSKTFGLAYDNYAAKTPRWLFF